MSQDRLLDRDDLDLYLLAHRAIRADISRFAQAVPTLLHARGGNEAARNLGRWFVQVHTLVKQHHTSEDTHLFPMLVSKDGAWAAHQRELEADHEVLDPALASIKTRFHALGEATPGQFDAARDALAAELTAMVKLMGDHLDREEAVTIASMTSTVTIGELKRFEKDSAKSMPMSLMTIILPWIMEAADERERAKINDILPWPVRLMYRWSWRRKFERMARPLAAAA